MVADIERPSFQNLLIRPWTVTVDRCSEKRYSKNLGQILEKKNFGGVIFLVKLHGRRQQITNKSNTPQGFFKEEVTCYGLEFQEHQVSRIYFSWCF